LKFILYILFSVFFLTAQELPNVRESYYGASKTRQSAEDFYKLLSKYNKSNKTLLAYKGAATALKSKFTADRKLKRDLFVEGVALVENSVKSEPNNTEIRLIRLSIQENTPKLLKYKGNIEEDKKAIISSFEKQAKDLQEYIIIYIKQSKVFTEKEKQTILK
jgi:hypothetical protein